MDLQDVADFFNRMECLDAYTGGFLFYGQLALYDDNKRDSETAERRVISLNPALSLPPRRVVQAAGTKFILGHRNPDDFGGVLRAGYVAQEAPYLSQVRTLGQICRNEVGTTAYAGSAWVKNAAFTEQSSKLVPQQHIYFAQDELILESMLVTLGPRLYVVRALNLGAGGMLVCTAEELPAPNIEVATVTNGPFDTLTETLAGTPTPVRLVRMRWQSLFRYGSNIAPSFGPDDAQVAIAKATMTVTAGALIVMSDGTWRVASALSEGDVWLCRVTRHA